ncbi:MAG: BON domain-containing protein [Verrucomicrobia bacterium]|nr:BON domain-containing protein [Verrucomicrobiota bacterium]MBV9671595.1 BON domain-containing protein [Verrucomicrobiota bacterium]
MKLILIPIVASIFVVCSSQGQQATATPGNTRASDSTAVDNTKRNSSDQNKTDTSEKQSNSQDDLTLTQKIRQAVMKGSLSMDAKNVKIIARDGKVTLKGPVDSQQEKDTVVNMAAEIAGKDKVSDQIEVKADKK